MAHITGDGTPIVFGPEGCPQRIVIEAGPEDLPEWKQRRADTKRRHLPTKNKWYTVSLVRGRQRGAGEDAAESARIVTTGLKPKTEELLRTLAFMQGLEGTEARPVIRVGLWRITVLGYAWRHRYLKDAEGNITAEVPDLDADALLVPIRDSLQGSHIIDTDARIVEAIGLTAHRKGKPGFRLTLERIA